MSDHRLQQLYREALAVREADRPACPAEDRLRALVEREGPEAERLATLDHVGACVACARELELLRALRVAAPARRRVSLASLAIAASLLLAVGGGVLIVRGTGPRSGDVVRGPSEAAVSLVAPTAGDRVLRWHRVPGAVSYTVEILARDGSLVASATTSDTMFAVPDSVRLAPDAADRWWVRARREDDTELRSALVPLPVAPR
jgi:hypothetical protein